MELTRLDPEERPTAREALAHPWLAGESTRDSMEESNRGGDGGVGGFRRMSPYVTKGVPCPRHSLQDKQRSSAALQEERPDVSQLWAAEWEVSGSVGPRARRSIDPDVRPADLTLIHLDLRLSGPQT
eukprot:896049-Prorocentrum_minimum.AAC.3